MTHLYQIGDFRVVEEVTRMFKVDESHLNNLTIEQLRAEVHDFAGRWIALSDAMRELPDLPRPELLHVLGDFAKWPEDHERGKLMQRTHTLAEIPPVSECEGGAGVWSVIRAALIEARKRQ
jgi:hypothetical protein